MKFLITISILIAGFAPSSHAVVLSDLPDAPSTPLPIDISAPLLACDEIEEALIKFQEMNSEHESTISTFLYQTVEKISSWYEVLSPLENKSMIIEQDTFAPVRNGAERMSMVLGLADENISLLAMELERIILSVRNCIPEQPTVKGKQH